MILLNSGRVTCSKRQPVYDEKAVERKKRRKTQKSGGARGPHVEDDTDTESSGMLKLSFAFNLHFFFAVNF